jgi:Uma2 family endonuclease
MNRVILQAVRARIVAHARLPIRGGAEHIMAMPAVKRRWTASEVRQLIAESPLATPRYELVDGELLVTPSPNWPHQRAVNLLWGALEEYLKRQPVGSVATSPFDVELAAESLVQPDVFVVPTHEVRRLLTEMPARELSLAAEVLSPSSGRHDRVTKRPHYQRHVPEYWIVDLDARLIERWRPGDERPEIITITLEWNPAGATAPFSLELHRYFAEVLGEA